MTDLSRRAVTTRVLVWRRAGQPRAKVYAFAGWGDARAVGDARRARLGRRHRQRFGIETSYRQKNQARAWTTSRDVGYRSRLEGLAHVLRQVRVRLCEEQARAAGLTPTAWVGLALADVPEAFADHLKRRYPDTGPLAL